MKSIPLQNSTAKTLNEYAFKIHIAICFISVFFTSITLYSNDSIGIELNKILFFESGNDTPEKNDRIYNDFFNPESRYINIEFTVNNQLYNKESKEYNITFIWKYFNGDEFGRMETLFNVKSEWTEAYISRGWGFANKGNWRLGRFTAQVLVNGVLFAEKDFCITAFDKGFITFVDDSLNMDRLDLLPKELSYKILHQYKIEPSPFFNYFYDITFNTDGTDIMYALSHFEYYAGTTNYSNSYYSQSNSGGASTTRDKYLFINNKQIVPNYFILNYDIDKSFKKLNYFGLKLTSTDITQAIGNAYYNGRIIYNWNAEMPVSISPDGKKYCYVINSMPAIKSAFTWDAAYEYLMLNNVRTQPDGLKIAKTINITKQSNDNLFEKDNSVVFVKNIDSTYNAVYTAKYKLIDEVYYALFNESSIVSPLFDGYISKPYLSADEKHVAYIVEDKKEWFIMLNDKRITKSYKEIKHSGALFSTVKNEIVFCGLGNTAVYRAKIDGDWYVMKGDEKISEGFSEIETIAISSDESQIAYKAKKGKKWSVYVNNRKISLDYDNIGEDLCFSPNFKNITYVAANNDSMWVMINKEKISPSFKKIHQERGYSGNHPLAISSLTFNKTGDKVAYVRVEEYSGNEFYEKIKHSYIFINEVQVTPKLYNAALFSKQAGELFVAGIDINNLIMHHVKIDF